MAGWTAILPFNFGRPRKTRLADILSEEARDTLALHMARHVASVLTAAPSVAAVHVLAPLDPGLPDTRWIADAGRGLNAELAAARATMPDTPVLFIHADLPLLHSDDVEALLAAAVENGAAIAPDAAAMGTNALALADAPPLLPCFGPDSFARHRLALPGVMPVERPGLRHDVDDADSLTAVIALGFVPPVAMRS